MQTQSVPALFCSPCVEKCFDDAEQIMEFTWPDQADDFCPIHGSHAIDDEICAELTSQYKDLVRILIRDQVRYAITLRSVSGFSGYHSVPMCLDHLFEAEMEG